ncbi:MAG: bifunctional heptose 7-phosphate kinase/heptose 1-phosphate adenyltransferase [Planctomycetota bacterium]
MTTPLPTAMLDAMRDTITRMAGVRVAVVGDMLLDRFLLGTSTRISREAPVLILRHQQTMEVPGGGANTVANVCALGAKAVALGAIGDDNEGQQLLALLERAGLDADARRLHLQRGWPTTTKTRILGGLSHSTMQQIVRIDREQELPEGDEPGATIARDLEQLWPTLDAVIVSDYGLGVVRPPLIEALRRLRATRPIPVTVDSRYALPLFRDLTSMTPNISEVEATLHDERLSHDLPRLELRGEQLRADLGLDALLVTRGKFGMSLFEPGAGPLHIPVFGTDQVADVTGAGDTVIATYTTALAAGASFEVAARLANVAGGLKVMKRGTAVVPAAELRAALAT